MSHRRCEEAAWTDKPAQIGQNAASDRFRKMHQRGGSPETIERRSSERGGCEDRFGSGV